MQIVAPIEANTSGLVVALTTALRARGFRVGTAEARSGIEGAAATVLTIGSGARLTLPGDLPPQTLATRAASIDPGLDLLLIEGGAPSAGTPTIEVVHAGATASAPRTDLLVTVTTTQLARAIDGGPSDDLGLAALIEERVLGTPGESGRLSRSVEAPIESERRLLDRPELGSRRRASRGWRGWLGL